MGGHNAGDVAAATAVDALEAFFRTFHADPRQVWPYPVDRSLSLGANLLRVGIKVGERQDPRGGGRRSIARAHGRRRSWRWRSAIAQIAIAHAGDSRAYRIARRVGSIA